MDGLFTDAFPVLDPNFERATHEQAPDGSFTGLFWLSLALVIPAVWCGCFGVVLLMLHESPVIPWAGAVALSSALGLVLGVIAIKSERE